MFVFDVSFQIEIEFLLTNLTKTIICCIRMEFFKSYNFFVYGHPFMKKLVVSFANFLAPKFLSTIHACKSGSAGFLSFVSISNMGLKFCDFDKCSGTEITSIGS